MACRRAWHDPTSVQVMRRGKSRQLNSWRGPSIEYSDDSGGTRWFLWTSVMFLSSNEKAELTNTWIILSLENEMWIKKKRERAINKETRCKGQGQKVSRKRKTTNVWIHSAKEVRVVTVDEWDLSKHNTDTRMHKHAQSTLWRALLRLF